MDYIYYFFLDALISGGILWLASKVTSVGLFFKTAILISGVSALVALIPSIGWLLSVAMFYYLLNKYSSAPLWPDLILMVIVSKLFSMVLLMGLFSYF